MQFRKEAVDKNPPAEPAGFRRNCTVLLAVARDEAKRGAGDPAIGTPPSKQWRPFMTNPYGQALGTRDALAALEDTPERIRRLVDGMREEDFTRSYGAGKWTVGQLLDHLAEAEIIFGVRMRMALTTPGYVVQPFDQDKMMAREARHTGRDAFDVYYALRRWNLPLYRSLSPEERNLRFTHPERGEMKVEDMLSLLAGHELHHLAQIEQATTDSRR